MNVHLHCSHPAFSSPTIPLCSSIDPCFVSLVALHLFLAKNLKSSCLCMHCEGSPCRYQDFTCEQVPAVLQLQQVWIQHRPWQPIETSIKMKQEGISPGVECTRRRWAVSCLTAVAKSKRKAKRKAQPHKYYFSPTPLPILWTFCCSLRFNPYCQVHKQPPLQMHASRLIIPLHFSQGL